MSNRTFATEQQPRAELIERKCIDGSHNHRHDLDKDGGAQTATHLLYLCQRIGFS